MTRKESEAGRRRICSLNLPRSLHCLFLVVSAGLEVSLSQPLAGIHHLDDVDKLLERHDGEGNASDDPWPGALELVGTRHLEGTGAPRAGEEAGWLGMGWVAGLSGRAIGDRL